MNENIAFRKNCREPYIGMPIYFDDLERRDDYMGDSDQSGNQNGNNSNVNNDIGLYNSCLEGWPLAMTYTPMQRWEETYDPEVALRMGTIFPSLDLPFLGGRRR